MSRLKNKKRSYSDIGYVFNARDLDVFTNYLKMIYRLNTKELTNLYEKINDEEFELLLKKNTTFTEKREIIKILNKYGI